MTTAKNRKATLATAAIVGAFIIGAGGLTLANWSASVNTDDSTITAGHLSISPEAPTWHYLGLSAAAPEITTAAAAAPADKPFTPWDGTAGDKIPPGATVTRVQKVTPKLEGTDLVANLAVAENGGLSGDLLAAGGKGVTANYLLFGADAAGAPVVTGKDTGIVAKFSSDGREGTVKADGGTTYTLVTVLHFSSSTDQQNLIDKTATLAGAGLTLTQVQP